MTEENNMQQDKDSDLLCSLDSLIQEISSKFDQIESTISNIPKELKIDSLNAHLSKIVEIIKPSTFMITSNQDFLSNTILLKEDFHKSISTINTALNTYLNSLNSIASSTDQQNLINIIDIDLDNFSQSLSIFTSNITEILNNITTLNQSGDPNPKEIEILKTRIGLESVLFNLSVNVQPINVSPFFKSKFIGVYKCYNRINEINQSVLALKSFCGTGKTNFVPLILMCRSLKDQMKSPFLILTQPSPRHVENNVKFFNSTISRYVTIIKKAEEFNETVTEFEKNPQNLTKIVFAIMTPPDLLPLMYKLRGSQVFYPSTRIIIDEIHQRTFHIDVLVSKISELNYVHKTFTIPLNVILMSASISQQILNPFRGDINVFSLIENSQYEIVEKTPIYEHFIEKVNNEVVRDEAVKVIEEMANINSKIERGNILCFLSSVSVCFKVCNSVFSFLSETDETDERRKIVFLQTKPKSNESMESFFKRLRNEYKINEEFREADGYKHDFFYVISFVFSGYAEDSLSDLIFNEFPEDLKNITKLICSTSLSESFNFEHLSVVIDSGLVKEPGFDINTSLTTMIETQASKEAMYQRKGRLGRSMKGLYIPIIVNKNVPDVQKPAIQRLDLTANVLLMKDISIDFEKIKNLPVRADKESVNFALENLKYVKAINNKNLKITKFGHEMLTFPFISIYYSAAVIQLREKFPKPEKEIAYFVASYLSTIISMENLLVREEMSEKLSRLFCEDSDVTTVFNALNILLKSEIKDNDLLREEVESYGFSYSSYLQLKDHFQEITNVVFPGKTTVDIISSKNFENFLTKYKGISSIIDRLITEIEDTYPNWCDIHYIKFNQVKGAGDFESRPTLIFDASEYLMFKRKSKAKAEVRIIKRPGWNGITIPTECYCFNINRNIPFQVNNGYLIHRVPSSSKIAITSIEVDQIALNPWFNVLLEIYCENEIKQCTPFLNNPKSFNENEIFHYSNVGGRVFVSFIPNSDSVKQRIQNGIKQCLLIMPFTPKSLLIYRNDAQTLVEVRIIGTQDYDSFNADKMHGDFLDKKKIDFCIKNIDKLKKSETDLRICALFFRETCLLEEYDQTHLFLINANYRDMPLIYDVIRKRIVQHSEEILKRRQLTNVYRTQRTQKNKDLGLFEFPPEFIHPALIHHKQTLDLILKWFSEKCDYANVIRVIGHKFLMKLKEIRELYIHLHNEKQQIKEQMNLNYVAIPVPSKVYSHSYQEIKQNPKWNYNDRFKVIIITNDDSKEVIEFIEKVESELLKSSDEIDKNRPDSSIVQEKLMGNALCCLIMCDDHDEPVLTNLPLTLYFRDGSTYTARICRGCIIDSLKFATNAYFNNGMIDKNALVNITSKPTPISTFPSVPIKNGLEFWPQISLGQLVSVLINNDKELSVLISAWLNIIAEFTIRTQLKHRFTFCPDHPNRIFDLEKMGRENFKCVVSDCRNEYCIYCTGWHDPKKFCAAKKESYKKSRISETYNKIKKCPRCHVETIKDGGCNHISCPCGCHWCYKCGKGFTSGGQCYAHMGIDRCALFDFDY